MKISEIIKILNEKTYKAKKELRKLIDEAIETEECSKEEKEVKKMYANLTSEVIIDGFHDILLRAFLKKSLENDDNGET